ncbi:MAG: pilus (MSHA type) biogenesis protein MshL [Gallionellaceae bacterium]|jgi:general secretion pathway protein D|nr:pilus (MSHA type) biogenesis protein MshL [Gallionellaceae bacterium]
MRLPHYLFCALLAACGTRPMPPSAQHFTGETFPPPMQAPTQAAIAPPAEPEETYSVVVQDVPALDVLFALARDAKINLDIHPGIQGNVTLNALNQPLERILERIETQIDLRHERVGGSLSVLPDTPYLYSYRIDYVDMTREAEGLISNAAQIGASAIAAAGSGPSIAGNNSALTIRSVGRNRFWETLTQNIKDILQVANADAAVIANPESGIVSVRATGRQHRKICEFIEQVMRRAQRQTMIEATVMEVRLSDEYRQGINWSRLRTGGTGFQLSQAGTPDLLTASAAGLFVLDYANPSSALGNLAAQVSLLESFGTVRVLSSPKLNVMNNQTAVLRVVDNLIYFTIKADTTTNQTNSLTTYTTTPNTVPIGFTMSVTPQIDDNDAVLLSLRPSISRLLGYVNDPNPALAEAGVISRIPQTQTREMESVLKIDDGQIAVLGGLMQDEVNNLSDEVPVLGAIPLLGNFFKNRDDTTQKTELVIFLRPTVIRRDNDAPLPK